MTQPTAGTILVLALLLCTSIAAADMLTITVRQTVVRAGPDSKRAILTTVSQGATFALLETRQSWYKILLDDGREGWVAQSAAQVQSEWGLGVVPGAAAPAPSLASIVRAGR